MKLSQAITHGATLRGESPHGEAGDRFVWITNTDELRSDAWGAACEAVQPGVARFNWRDRYQYERSMDALRAVQHHYFRDYFNPDKYPVICPGSQQNFIAMGGRIVGEKNDQPVIKIYERGQTTGNLGGVTSECDRVVQMAGMVDHLFYAHGWSREQIAEVVHWYETNKSLRGVVFNHYQSPAMAKAVQQGLTEPLSAYPKVAKAVRR